MIKLEEAEHQHKHLKTSLQNSLISGTFFLPLCHQRLRCQKIIIHDNMPDTTLSMDMGLKMSQLLVPLGAHPAAALRLDNSNKLRKKIMGCLESGTTDWKGGRSSPIKCLLW